MPRLIVLDIAPATETHCGDGHAECQFLEQGLGRCRVWSLPGEDLLHDDDVGYVRLHKCSAAEQRAKQ